MARARGGNRRTGSEGGWLGTLLGVVLLTAGGFVFGLVAGVVSEEPELVVGHVAGESVEVAWSDASEPSVAVPELAGPVPTEPADEVPAPDPVSSPPPPPLAPKPVAKARARLAGSTGYAIQVGAFSESRSAEGLAASLRGKGFPAQVHGSAGDGRWRVRVGPLGTSQEAERMASRLKSEERLPTWVLQEGSH